MRLTPQRNFGPANICKGEVMSCIAHQDRSRYCSDKADMTKALFFNPKKIIYWQSKSAESYVTMTTRLNNILSELTKMRSKHGYRHYY